MSTLIDRDPLAHLPATPVVARDGRPAAVTSFLLGDMLVFAVVTYAGELVQAHAYTDGVPVQMLAENGQPGTTWASA